MKETQSIGTILVIFSLSIQLKLFFEVYSSIKLYFLQIIFILFSPIFLLVTSFFCFYFVNLVYNIFSPKKWIEQNSKYLSFYIPLCIKYATTPTTFAIEKQEEPTIVIIEETFDAMYDGELSMDIEMGYNTNEETKHYLLPFHQPNTLDLDLDFNIICTIQIPVYTEDFEETLKPTFENVLQSCRRYNADNDAKINVFINDDGLLKINEMDRQKRIHFYHSNPEIFYVGRPVEGRQGKFKKASNMNYCLQQYLREEMNEMKDDEMCLSGGLFKIGKYILLLDSVSRVSFHCFDKLFLEMEKDLQLGFLQVRTNTLRVANNKWENAIAHFTNALYSVNFFYSCSNGFPSPLVGHNCLLRWEAIMKVEKELNGYDERPICTWKVWDETRVSEDFVMSLTMQTIGYYGKYIMYDCGMMEGVSLTILDEIVKLKKFMYGIHEIMFYPIAEWMTKGITTHLFHKLILTPQITFSTKYALMSYIGSYFAVMLSPVFCAFYFVVKIGFPSIYECFYFTQNPEFVLICCVIVFLFLSFMSNVVVRWKHGFYLNFWELVVEELYYGFFLTCFFGGLSYHLCVMTVVYFLRLNANWGTTNKELQQINGFDFIKEYKRMYFLALMVICGLVVLNVWYEGKYWRESLPLVVMIGMHCGFPFMTFG